MSQQPPWLDLEATGLVWSQLVQIRDYDDVREPIETFEGLLELWEDFDS